MKFQTTLKHNNYYYYSSIFTHETETVEYKDIPYMYNRL